MECPFCFQMEEERTIVKNEHAFAVICAEPLNAGHVLVCPCRHVEHISDLTALEAKALFDLVGRMDLALPKLFTDAPIVFINRGKHGTQSHLHIHILPSKGGIRDLFSAFEQIPRRVTKPMTELTAMADALRATL